MTDNPSVPDNGPSQRSQQAPRSHEEVGPSFASAEPPVRDLSTEIALAVRKSAGERVTCRRIFGNTYRCNWWSAADTAGYDNPGMTGQLVTTHRVRRSELVRAINTRTGLLIETIATR